MLCSMEKLCMAQMEMNLKMFGDEFCPPDGLERMLKLLQGKRILEVV